MDDKPDLRYGASPLTPDRSPFPPLQPDTIGTTSELEKRITFFTDIFQDACTLHYPPTHSFPMPAQEKYFLPSVRRQSAAKAGWGEDDRLNNCTTPLPTCR